MTRPAFDYVDGVLHAEGVSAVSLAEQFGTPLYVYSRAALTAAHAPAVARACTSPSRPTAI
jgi:diaminopimelate decarboxylase